MPYMYKVGVINLQSVFQMKQTNSRINPMSCDYIYIPTEYNVQTRYKALPQTTHVIEKLVKYTKSTLKSLALTRSTKCKNYQMLLNVYMLSSARRYIQCAQLPILPHKEIVLRENSALYFFIKMVYKRANAQ